MIEGTTSLSNAAKNREIKGCTAVRLRLGQPGEDAVSLGCYGEESDTRRILAFAIDTSTPSTEGPQ